MSLSKKDFTDGILTGWLEKVIYGSVEDPSCETMVSQLKDVFINYLKEVLDEIPLEFEDLLDELNLKLNSRNKKKMYKMLEEIIFSDSKAVGLKESIKNIQRYIENIPNKFHLIFEEIKNDFPFYAEQFRKDQKIEEYSNTSTNKEISDFLTEVAPRIARISQELDKREG